MYSDADLGLQSAAHYEQKLRLFEKSAEEGLKRGDESSAAAALLHLGYTYEKLRNFSAAAPLIHRAIEMYDAAHDREGAANCFHTMGVLTFHNGSEDESIAFFDKACRLRDQLHDHLSCAQSWHNRSYVHCRVGQSHAAFDGYAKAGHKIEAGCAVGQARLVKSAKDHRDLAFVLSHLAFAHAKFTGSAEALDGATRYFEHVARTGIHREHLLVYLAIALALSAGIPAASEIEMRRIVEFTGLPPNPASFFEFILKDRDEKTYLGTVVLALMEYGSFLSNSGERARGTEMMREAVQLCVERGWRGEAERAVRFAEECAPNASVRVAFQKFAQ